MFTDRIDAGEQLASLLKDLHVHADLVLAIPRGGLPVGRVIADALDVPLDVVVARKIGAPNTPELAIGAVTSDGSTWYNQELITELGVTDEYLSTAHAQEQVNAHQRLMQYRNTPDPVYATEKRVLLVDDGVATGATILACIKQLRRNGAATIMVAVPVGPSDTIKKLGLEADAVYCLNQPGTVSAVSQHYRDFEQVSDDAAQTYLHQK